MCRGSISQIRVLQPVELYLTALIHQHAFLKRCSPRLALFRVAMVCVTADWNFETVDLEPIKTNSEINCTTFLRSKLHAMQCLSLRTCQQCSTGAPQYPPNSFTQLLSGKLYPELLERTKTAKNSHTLARNFSSAQEGPRSKPYGSDTKINLQSANYIIDKIDYTHLYKN